MPRGRRSGVQATVQEAAAAAEGCTSGSNPADAAKGQTDPLGEDVDEYMDETAEEEGMQQRKRSGSSWPNAAAADVSGSSPSTSRQMIHAMTPLRELKVRLTHNLSTRKYAIRRFVDLMLCHASSDPFFQIVKDEKDVYRLKHGDYLLRLKLTFNTKRDEDDLYNQDYLSEIKFRGRLFKYNEDKDSFEELGVDTQCMAICLVASCRRSLSNRITPGITQ